MSYVFDACSLLNLTRALADEVVDVLKGNLTVSLAYYEIANALWKECILKRISVEEAVKTLRFIYSMLELMNVVQIKKVDIGTTTLSMAYKLNITYYDATYLNTAKELDKILVTDDEELRRKAERVGIKTLSSEKLTQQV